MPIAEQHDRTPRLETRVRSRDADTSYQAAEITPRALSTLKINVIEIVRTLGPITDDAIYDEYRRRVQNGIKGYMPRSQQRVRTARHELTILTNPPILKRESEDGKSNLNHNSQTWSFIEPTQRVIHEYVRPTHPENLYTGKVCDGCGEWTCPVADAYEDVPE